MMDDANADEPAPEEKGAVISLDAFRKT